jgi:uncharacterized RDD family membrane protein YckC
MITPTKVWYFVDAQGQQQGPVSAAIIAGHARQGHLHNDSLLWREGLDSWQPLSQLRAELNIPDPSASARQPALPPSPPSATPAQPYAAAAASPYAPPSARLQSTDKWSAMDGQDVVYAGFLRRWAAFFIDSLVVGVCFYAIAMVLSVFMAVGVAGLAGSDGSDAVAMGLVFGIYVVYFLLAGLYYALMESSVNQATLGKMALGIKVTDLQGRRLSVAQAFGRWFSALLSYLILWIGFLMAAFTEQKRALHDYIAGTLVVDRWAYTEFPERQQRSPHGCLIAFVIVMGLIMVTAVVGILAAIAIPAYRDYVDRAGRRSSMAPAAIEQPFVASADPSLPGADRLWLPPRA